jgi:hypothetical protein
MPFFGLVKMANKILTAENLEFVICLIYIFLECGDLLCLGEALAKTGRRF